MKREKRNVHFRFSCFLTLNSTGLENWTELNVLDTHCTIPGKAHVSLVDVCNPPGEVDTRFRS